MHIDLTEQNATAIREMSIILDLPSAKIVNFLLEQVTYEIQKENIVLMLNREKIENLRANMKLLNKNTNGEWAHIGERYQ